MKNKKVYIITWDGEIIVTNFFTWYKRFWRFITGKPIFETVVYTPKKKYSKLELNKLRELLVLCEDDLESNTTVINTIRPNTFSKSISEVENNKYYAIAD